MLDRNNQIPEKVETKKKEKEPLLAAKPRSSGSAERARKLWEHKAWIYYRDLLKIGYDYSTTQLRRQMDSETIRTSGKPGTPRYKEWPEENQYVLPEWEPIFPGSRKKGWRPHVMLEYLIRIGFLD
jgi:hypothetical protein